MQLGAGKVQLRSYLALWSINLQTLDAGKELVNPVPADRIPSNTKADYHASAFAFLILGLNYSIIVS